MLDLQLRKRFGAQFRLDVRLRSEARRLVLFGHSGSGKTLTLQALAGLVRPDEGHVEVDGRVLYDGARGIDIPARRRGLGYVFQDYALFPHLTVRKNVAFALEHGGPLWNRPARTEVRRAVDALLERFEIAHLGDRLPAEISGGQRQRTALARALIVQPCLLLLDEPFSALDPLLRVRMRREIRSLLDEWNIPLVLITHDPEDVDAFADALAVYRDGMILEQIDDYPARRLSADGALAFLASLVGE